MFNDTERTQRTDLRDHFGAETTLAYKRDIKRHTVDAVGGVAYEYWEYSRALIDAGGFINDATEVIAIGDDSVVTTLLGEETFE